MKLFLLTAGDQYYPSSGEGDWIACYETYEEARAAVRKGPIKTRYGTEYNYQITHSDGTTRLVDWYEIIDLSYWINS